MSWLIFWNWVGWGLFWLLGFWIGWIAKSAKDHPDDWFD